MTEGYIIDMGYGSEAYYSLAAILWTLVALTAWKWLWLTVTLLKWFIQCIF